MACCFMDFLFLFLFYGLDCQWYQNSSFCNNIPTHLYPKLFNIFIVNLSQWFIIEVCSSSRFQYSMDNKYNMDRLAFSLVVGI